MAHPTDDILDPDDMGNFHLLCRAITEEWPIKSEHLKVAVMRISQVLADPAATKSQWMKGVRALALLKGQNIELVKMSMINHPQLHYHQHQHQAVDYSKIPVDRLKRIEEELLALSGSDVARRETGDLSPESLRVHASGMAAD